MPALFQRKRDRTPANSEAVTPARADQVQATEASSGEAQEGDIFSQLDKLKKDTGVKKEKLFDEVSSKTSACRAGYP